MGFRFSTVATVERGKGTREKCYPKDLVYVSLKRGLICQFMPNSRRRKVGHSPTLTIKRWMPYHPKEYFGSVVASQARKCLSRHESTFKKIKPEVKKCIIEKSSSNLTKVWTRHSLVSMHPRSPFGELIEGRLAHRQLIVYTDPLRWFHSGTFGRLWSRYLEGK